ncbi:uncharacterized protein LOC123553451 [Mercenaria mercenaria]|uniref:uncharacterized protein LOC123553451 n=1 Tax=Mercenaria mercenaria TaxID=6596 RepID=UPI00234F1939|nr:uncharacterized protein LOC123553451 [Mercenaria mercenaria]
MSGRYGIKQSLKKLAVKYVAPKIEEPKKPDHLCTPCSRERKDVEATNYCPDCDEKLCSMCVAQHKKFQILKTHKVLGVHEAPVMEAPVQEKQKLADTCEHHASKLIDLYCTSHDEVGCAACIAINHKECPEPVYITKTAKGLSKSNIPKDTKEEILRVKKDVFMLKLRRQNDKRRFTKERDGILAVIGSLRMRLNEVFDKLEAAAREKLNQKYDKDMKVIKHDIHICDEAIHALEEALKKLKAENDSQLFVNIKRDAKKSIEKGESVILPVTEHLGQETVNFTVDESLEEWIGKLSSIGKFDHEQSAYTGVLFGKYDLNQKSDPDHDDYVFNGSVNLSNGNSIFTDWKNKRLKLIDIKYNLRSHCDVPGEPYSVCYIDDSLVATTLRDEKLIQFVAVAETKLTLDKRFKIDEYCRGIAYKNNQLYITVGGGEGEIHGQLRVYSMHGGLLRIYEEDVQGKPFFSSPGFIVINDDGLRFHVSDHKKGVVTVTKDGRLASVFNDHCLKNPLGLCMDGKGNLFVSGRESNNVVQFTADGKKMCEVLTEADGITSPLAICCHESVNTRLLVTMENSFTMKVFTLQEK